MHISPTQMTVADYCEGLEAGSIIVDHRYQRSNQVWPAAAQSFLVETMLLGFPVPKLSLFQQTDRISRKSIKQIIDGQQRSEAIRRFYNNDLRLAKTLELGRAAGRTYDELDEDLQDTFLAYSLGIDLFVESTERDVREVFRRINSYDVPLNPEEQRHAEFQGDFKWYIYHLSTRLDEQFTFLGAFTTRQMVRMQDMKLLTELTHAFVNGITTTSKTSLYTIYRSNEKSFLQRTEYTDRIVEAVETIVTWSDVANGQLVKPHVLYSLILAITHALKKVDTLSECGLGGRGLAEVKTILELLAPLADLLEIKDGPKELRPFLAASVDRTNVSSQRRVRFQFLLEAVSKHSSFPPAI